MYTAIRTTSSLFREFLRMRNGSVVSIFAFAMLPLALLVGGLLDYSRATRAYGAAQLASDAAVIAAATLKTDDISAMRAVAEKVLRSNFDEAAHGVLKIDEFNYKADGKAITLRVSGAVDTAFLPLIRMDKLPYGARASAVRAEPEQTEVVLVLDNTWSMVGTKIAALKEAADNLVMTLTKDPKSNVKVGLVPYADYVNVGTSNRAKSWLRVPADYTKINPGSCWTQDKTCVRGIPKTCTRVVDGVSEQYDCTPSICTPIPPYKVCSKDSTQTFRWYGCVGSRNTGNLRLTDEDPSSPYPGLLSTSQNCLNPIVPLTDQAAKVRAAIKAMIVNVGGYKPSTYIPAGLVWGLNVLSNAEPFSEGDAYDPDNKRPRKVMVLMTDGANTLKMNTADGRHVDASGAALDQTYTDMTSICRNIKAKNIKLYTVAFSVDDAKARTTLQSCATDSDHYFDAKDAQALNQAFAQIASSLSSLRLTQ